MIDQLIGLLEESRQRGFLGPGPVEEHLDDEGKHVPVATVY